MIEKIRENIFRINVPMPNNPLKYLNAYVLKGSERTCLIDTGLNRDSCWQALNQGLDELKVDIPSLDILVTHVHSDHSGLVPKLHSLGARIFMSQEDGEALNQPLDINTFMHFAHRNGLPEEQLQKAVDSHPGFKYRPRGTVELNEVHDGDTLIYAGMSLYCLLTPGHTSGHLCFYQPDQGLLFAGDMLLEEITPNISQWLPGEHPLNQYMESLDRISDLDVSLVLPGHRRLFADHVQRAKEIKHHHFQRLEEVKRLVAQNPSHGFEIASRMSWDLDTADWNKFPLAQKWFATGEALAHLSYLESQGEISKETSGEHHIWTKAT
jgi:glyoxylase-like metal-dependent hydrolase (beta-lactamase superfamily II)